MALARERRIGVSTIARNAVAHPATLTAPCGALANLSRNTFPVRRLLRQRSFPAASRSAGQVFERSPKLRKAARTTFAPRTRLDHRRRQRGVRHAAGGQVCTGVADQTREQGLQRSRDKVTSIPPRGCLTHIAVATGAQPSAAHATRHPANPAPARYSDLARHRHQKVLCRANPTCRLALRTAACRSVYLALTPFRFPRGAASSCRKAHSGRAPLAGVQ
jgi:hypothetical protein